MVQTATAWGPKRITVSRAIKGGVYRISKEDRVNTDFEDASDSFRISVKGTSLSCTRIDEPGGSWCMDLIVRLPTEDQVFS